MESIKAMIETITTTEVEQPSFRLSLRDRLSSIPPLKPEYFGDEIANECAQSQGWTIWDLAGKLLEIWNTDIHPRVKEILCENRNELCRKARNPPVAGLHGWITGKSKVTACPTILIVCRDKHYRKVAKSLIRDGGLIDLLIEDNIYFKFMALPSLIKRPAGSWDNRNVYSSSRKIGKSIIGLPIRVLSPNEKQISQSRVGGLVLVDGKPYGMTVAHVFEDPDKLGPSSPMNETSDSDTDEEEDDTWGWSASSSSTNSDRNPPKSVICKQFFATQSLTESFSPSKAASSDSPPTPREFPVLGVLEGLAAVNTEHDWALVAIYQEVALGLSNKQLEETKRFQATPGTGIASEISRGNIFAITDDMISGTISSTLCSVKFGGRLVDHWSVRLERPLGALKPPLFSFPCSSLLIFHSPWRLWNLGLRRLRRGSARYGHTAV